MTSNQIALFSAREQQRSDLAREKETHRANVKQERIALRQLHETKRSNKANESIGRRNARSNRITSLANRRNARSNARNARTNAKNARTNAYNARTNRLNSDRNFAVANARLRQDWTQAQLNRRYGATQNYLQRQHEKALAELNAKLGSARDENKLIYELQNWMTKNKHQFTQDQILQYIKNMGNLSGGALSAITSFFGMLR